MRTITTIFAFIFLALSNIVAQSFETANVRATASGSIPSDNTLRYYRLAIPVTRTAYEEDLGGNYNNVLQFWRECEEFANRMFVPLGICFDVVEDQRLVKTDFFAYEEDVYALQANGTTNTNDLIGEDSYDVGMWVHHRDIYAENSGLSALGGVYSDIAKGSGYSKTDKWVVAHELGHMFGAPHTTNGEGSLMDSGGDDFFSYPSIKKIRDFAVGNGAGSANNAVNVSNSAPVFNNANMENSYRIPQGACIAIPVYANDADGNMLTYSAIGCSSSTVGNVEEDGGYMPHFASLIPQTSNIIDYRPKFTADIVNASYYYEQAGTNIPAMSAGSYDIAILVNDVPASMEYDYLVSNPFYSNYAVWDATVQIVGGTAFNASMSPAKNSYSAGEQVTVSWGVNSNYFTADSRLRITMSTDYGKTFAYVLADNVPALDGNKVVTLPDINVGNIDVDFKTATRSKRGGIIRVEEIGGVAYTLTTLDPTDGKDFNITGGSGAPITYTISVTAGDGGTATIDGKSSTTVEAGSSVTLTATPNDGYIFDAWYSGGSFVSPQAEYTFIPTASGTYNALFEEEAGTPVTYNITATASPAAGGTATVNGSASATVEANGTIELSAKANDGYTFVNWTNGGKEVTTQADYKIYNVAGDADYVANFQAANPTTFAVTTTANPIKGGTATFSVGTNPATSSATVASGTQITLYANENTGYNFVNWTKGGKEVSTNATHNVTITEASDYVANFEEEAQVPTYKITATANPAEGGTATVNGKALVEVEANGTIELSAQANNGYEFVNWTNGGKEVTTQADYKIYNVAGDADYVANFKEDGSGSDPQPSTGLGGKWYRIKDNASGKYIDINKDGATDASHGNVIMSDKDEDSKRQIIYFETSGDGYKLKAATGDYIKCEQWNVSAGDANSAATLIFEETGDLYYIKWNHTSYQNNIYYFKVENAKGGDYALHPYDDAASTSIAAKWKLEEVKYTISVSASEGGTAEVATGGGGGAASVEVPYDGSATLTASPASGFKFVNWTKGGTLFSEETELTVNNIQANAEYVANFEPEVQDELTTGYYHIVSRVTTSHEYLYNNALRTNNSKEFTLQSDSKITTNNGIWYITVNNKQLGVKNGDGNALVTGAAYCGAATSHNTLNIEKTTDVGGVTYYSFVEGLNCTNRTQYNFTLEGGKYVSDTDNNYVTTWTGHPDAEANQWRLERVDTDGKNIYDVVVECTENDVYVTYGSEYAFNGGFFITDATITAQQLTAKKGNDAAQGVTVLVEGNTIRVVDTEYVDITVSTTPAESGSVKINGETTGTKSVIIGSSVTLNATPAKGYRFLNWSDAKGSIVSETAEYTFKPTESGEYFANFMRTYTIQIRTNSAEAGSATVNGSTSSVTIDDGAWITLVAEANPGYEFMGWEIDGVRIAGVDITKPYTTNDIIDDATFTAIFSTITEYTKLEDGVAYNIRARMEDGSYRYVYCDGTNLKYSMDKGSSDSYIFVVQKTDDKKVNLISALGYYGWNQNGTLSNEYAKIEIANGIGMEGRTLYSATGTYFYTFSTDDNGNIEAIGGPAINKSVAGDVTSDFDFVEATDYKFKVSVADGSNAKLGTINLPFATKLPDGITAYMAKVQDDDLVMTELDLTDKILPANTPVLIEGTSSGTFDFAPAPASNETYDTGFSGTLDAKDIDSNVMAYILSYDGAGTEIKFYKLSSTSRKINANKAYFVASTGSPATAFRIRFAGVTGIDGIEEENEMHESVYDLQGRKLEKVTSPGIYIVDGKKKYIK